METRTFNDGRTGYTVEEKLQWRFKFYLGQTRQDGLAVDPGELQDWLENGPDLLLPGYTLYGASGRWQGGNERTLVIEVIGDEWLTGKLRDLAGTYCNRFNQAEVWMTGDPISRHIIRPLEAETEAA